MPSINLRICYCILCKKQTSQLGIITHYERTHNNSSLWDNLKDTQSKKKNNNISKYDLSPNYCKKCNCLLSYKQRNNKFCSKTCSGTFNNLKRYEQGYTMSEETRKLLSEKIISNLKKENKYVAKPSVVGEFCSVHFAKCKFCTKHFTSNKVQHVCSKCQHLKYNNNKDKWSFKFNVFDYPDLFDLNLIKEIGWCSFGGKRGGKQNLNGLSRDHKVSVNEAKKNNYDPYYITHPCNCQIISMSENNKKKTKSSISYAELIRLVDEYDLRGRH